MKAEIINLTPSKAKELLEMNVGNRDIKKSARLDYVRQMRDGSWKENGEPIIVDYNGVVKDGQHRLIAVIESGISYTVPLITGVASNVMDTIDTGTNRSLADVLKLNGFNWSNRIANLSKQIINYDRGFTPSNQGVKRTVVTNSQGLKFSNDNKQKLTELCQVSDRIYRNQKINLLNPAEIGLYLYAIRGWDNNDLSTPFIKGLCSNSLGETSCTSYGYKKLLSAKVNKITLSNTYKHNLMARLWSIFQDDIPVKSLRINIDKMNHIK